MHRNPNNGPMLSAKKGSAALCTFDRSHWDACPLWAASMTVWSRDPQALHQLRIYELQKRTDLGAKYLGRWYISCLNAEWKELVVIVHTACTFSIHSLYIRCVTCRAGRVISIWNSCAIHNTPRTTTPHHNTIQLTRTHNEHCLCVA